MTETETEIVSREEGARLAKVFRDFEEVDAEAQQLLRNIPFTLLSASQIKVLVTKTGAISPFFESASGKSRLKMSSYEGRIGEVAYQFNGDSAPKRIFDRKINESLLIPKNSIVFVECDIDFRLPEFVAARFNLQIVHVHRGLLLGTGPLVDPGFWGKLCIPIHNLTDEDYCIPRDQGLIWVEFTKTTAAIEGEPLGRRPFGGKEFWDISAFLDKASRQFGQDRERPKVPIQSSLPTMFRDANQAATSAKNAAERSAKSSVWMSRLSILSAIGAAVAVGALLAQFVSMNSSTRSVLNDLQPKIAEFERQLKSQSSTLPTWAEFRGDTESYIQSSNDIMSQNSDGLEAITAELARQLDENAGLQSKLAEFQASIAALEAELSGLRVELERDR